jgi:hypothetical protein
MTPAPSSLIGAWRLVSAVATGDDGAAHAAPFGDHPTGLLTYTRSTVTVLIAYGGRPRLAFDGDHGEVPADARAAGFATFFGYGGRYEVAGDTVVHDVEVASIEDWVGSAMVREVELDGDRLTLRTPRVAVAGVRGRFELVWERVPGS